MLSKALQQVGGYFDRRVLVSVFFPSLVAWGAVAAVAVLSGNTPPQALDRWKALEGAGQAVLAVAFFAWVIFWTFLTANFRLGFIRFFEGYPPEPMFFRLLRL